MQKSCTPKSSFFKVAEIGHLKFRPGIFYFRPKSAGTSPHLLVSHFNNGLR